MLKTWIKIRDGFKSGKKLPFLDGSAEQNGVVYEYSLAVDAASTHLHFELKDTETKKAYRASADMQDAFKEWLVFTITKIENEKARKNINR